MPHMQQVEAAVGERHPLAIRPPGVHAAHQFVSRQHLVHRVESNVRRQRGQQLMLLDRHSADFATTMPAAIFASWTAVSIGFSPEANPSASTEITVSPAPDTSNTCRATAGKITLLSWSEYQGDSLFAQRRCHELQIEAPSPSARPPSASCPDCGSSSREAAASSSQIWANCSAHHDTGQNRNSWDRPVPESPASRAAAITFWQTSAESTPFGIVGKHHGMATRQLRQQRSPAARS
jgi:hypothetical protein